MKLTFDFDEQQIEKAIERNLSSNLNRIIKEKMDEYINSVASSYISSKEIDRKIQKYCEDNILAVVVQYLGRRVHYLFDDMVDKIITQKPTYPSTVSDEERGFYTGLYAAWVAYSSQPISEKIMDSKDVQQEFINRVYANYISSSSYSQLKRTIKAEMLKNI